jgi:hypothetical protein
MGMVRNIAPYDILFITQPPKPVSLVSQGVKPLFPALPAYLASEQGKKHNQATAWATSYPSYPLFSLIRANQR